MSASSDHLLEQLQLMMQQLRAQESGCAWCQKQTLASLTQFTIEEAYELQAAIRDNDNDEIRMELADLLLQVLFYTQITQEEQRFTLADVMQTLIHKLERRNPHVFGQSYLKTVADIKQQWQTIKSQERYSRSNAPQQLSLLADIPDTLPATLRSNKIQTRVASVNFDWNTPEEVIEVLNEEIQELQEALQLPHDQEAAITDEFGDILFTCVNLARHLNTTIEDALNKANTKFMRRFQHMERIIKQQNQEITDFSFSELLTYWTQAKKDDNDYE